MDKNLPVIPVGTVKYGFNLNAYLAEDANLFIITVHIPVSKNQIPEFL
jgi:hypothetical protein